MSLACATYSSLPSRARGWRERIDLRAIARTNWILIRPIVFVGGAWRKPFIVTRATIHSAIVLTRILTAILATILPRDKTVLRESVFLGDQGSED
jgi:hypothetical protein